MKLGNKAFLHKKLLKKYLRLKKILFLVQIDTCLSFFYEIDRIDFIYKLLHNIF